MILGVSEAKNAQEIDFDVKMRLAPQKPGKHDEKCDFWMDFLRFFVFCFFDVFLRIKGRRRLKIGQKGTLGVPENVFC